MKSNNKSNGLNPANLIFSILPLIIAVVLQYVVILGDILILFIYNIFSDERSVGTQTPGQILTEQYNQPMNLAFMTLVKFLMFFVIFGIWYYKVFCKYKVTDETFTIRGYAKFALEPTFTSLTPIFMIIAGVAGQFMVDGILALLRPAFPNAFQDYDSMVQDVTGAASSWVLLLAVMVVAPLGEEFLFRGLTQRYAKRSLGITLAVIFQAILFGVYHGNIIQGGYAFVLGAVLGYLAYSFGSITPGILLHMFLNISLFFVPDALFETTARCVITSIVSALIFVASILFAVKLHKKKQ